MNAFTRKKALSDASRRAHITRHPSFCRSGIAQTEYYRRMQEYHRPKYNRHGFNKPSWWTPDHLNDIAM